MIANGSASAGLRANLNYFSGGAATVTLASLLPQVTAGTVLDGQTQPGWTSAPVIAVTGAVSVGLDASWAANATAISIQGLSLYGMTGEAFRKKSAGDLSIRGCYIGLTPAGTISSVGGYGINLTVTTVDIGGTSAITRNVIVAATTAGIYADSSAGTIRGNYIGVLPDGSAASIKNAIGLITLGAGKQIGGSNAGEGNTISSSTSMGVEVVGTTSNQNFINNFIGTDPTGAQARANARGIVVATVGGFSTPTGTMTFTGNVIAGNSGNGIDISVGSNYTITGNLIGVNAAGNATLANAGAGIALQSVSTVTIGGSSTALGNVIGGNTGAGISATAATSLVVQNNRIGSNSAGTVALANGGNGITLAGTTTGAQIGGTSTTLGNLIANNAKGVALAAPAAQNLI